jgi:precorrin-6Y C5,15-methyltransferase (decarboxylating)
LIYVIGIGVGGRTSLTKRPLGIIGRAGLIVGGKRHLDEFPEADAQKLPIKGGLERTAGVIEDFIFRKGGEGGGRPHVAVLATGDPSLFGIADFIIKKFGKRRVEIIPNVSVVQEAFARIKEKMQGLKVLSAHGRPLEGGFLRELLDAEKAAVFTDPKNTPEKISKALLDSGASGVTAYVCSNLGTTDESVKKGTLADIARGGPYPSLNTMVIIRDKKSAGRGAVPFTIPGIPDKEFSSSTGMITKEEVRVVALSKLRLRSDSVVWDIGSGSGSVAVEAALIAMEGKVYAIEKKRARARDIRENKARFNAHNLGVIEGAAPACLASIGLAPDAVFVGGGGGGGKDLKDILTYAARRVKRGGRVVVNAVTMETAFTAFGFFKRKKWDKELVLVSVSRSKEIGAMEILSAGNPVFVITGVRP